MAATLVCIMSPASAAVIGLTFEGVANNAAVLNFYNGGSDSAGNMGTNYGVSFGSDSLALIDFPAGAGNFENEPSPDTVLYFLGTSAVLNFASGFEAGFSFFYSAGAAATVTVWANLGGSASAPTGAMPLATIDLAANWQDNGCDTSNGQFCNWDPIGASFSGTALSVEFGGASNLVGYDNITFGSMNPVPLPAGVWLLASGVLGFAALRRRRSAGS